MRAAVRTNRAEPRDIVPHPLMAAGADVHVETDIAILLHEAETKPGILPGRWNLDKKTGRLKGAIAQAVARANRILPELEHLAPMLTRMPGMPLVTSGVSRPQTEYLARALDWNFVSTDTSTHINAVSVRCPREAMSKLPYLSRKGLPAPVCIVGDDVDVDMIWLLGWPVRRSSVRPPPFCDLVSRLLAEALGGDVTDTPRNPWSTQTIGDFHVPVWQTFSTGGTTTTLVDLVRPLTEPFGPAISARSHHAHDLINIKGRNRTVFDRVRFWAYDNWWHYQGDEDQFLSDLLIVATENNSFKGTVFATSGPLDEAELRGICSRIHEFVTSPDFCSKRRTTHGIMNLGQTGLRLPEKQRLAAYYAAQHRRHRTDCDIWDAACRLRTQGREITKSAVAAESGRSIRTLDRRWVSLTEALAREPHALPTAQGAPRVVRSFADAPSSASRTACTRHCDNRCTSESDGKVFDGSLKIGASIRDPIIHRYDKDLLGSDTDLESCQHSKGVVRDDVGTKRTTLVSLPVFEERSPTDQCSSAESVVLRIQSRFLTPDNDLGRGTDDACRMTTLLEASGRLQGRSDATRVLFPRKQTHSLFMPSELEEIMSRFQAFRTLDEDHDGDDDDYGDAWSMVMALSEPPDIVSRRNTRGADLLTTAIVQPSADLGIVVIDESDREDDVPDTVTDECDELWFAIADALPPLRDNDGMFPDKRDPFDALRRMPTETASSILEAAFGKFCVPLPVDPVPFVIDELESCFSREGAGIRALVATEVVLLVEPLLDVDGDAEERPHHHRFNQAMRKLWATDGASFGAAEIVPFPSRRRE